jgi:hypothetical protein
MLHYTGKGLFDLLPFDLGVVNASPDLPAYRDKLSQGGGLRKIFKNWRPRRKKEKEKSLPTASPAGR